MNSLRSLVRSAMGNSLKATVLRGGAWLGAGSTLEQVLRFVRNMVLTRLLLPEAFGTMAIVMSVSMAIDSFTQMGIKDAVVQNPHGNEDSRLNVAWWLATGRALGLYLSGCIAAPWVAGFYKNPGLSPLLRVAMLSILFSGAMSPRAYAALKQLRFNRWAFIYHGGAIFGILLTLALCTVWPSVWSLVIGFTAEAAGRWMVSFFLGPFMPRLHLDREALTEILAFSRGVFGLPLLAFLCLNIDIFVIGKMFSRSELGVYGMAVTLAQAPSMFVLNLLGQLMVPAFARVQTENERTNRMLINVSAALLIVGLPLCVFACLYARPLLALVYGTAYAGAAVSFALACGAAMANIVNGPLTAVFFARGMPRSHWRFAFSRTIALAVLIVPFLKWFGIPGAPLAALLAIVIGYGFQLGRMVQVTGLDMSTYGKTCSIAAALSAVVIASRLGSAWFLTPVRPVFLIAFGLSSCMVAYVIALLFMVRKRKSEEESYLQVAASAL